MPEKSDNFTPLILPELLDLEDRKPDKGSGFSAEHPTTINPRPIRRKGSIRPIILSLLLVLTFGKGKLDAQVTGSISLGAVYFDNVFQLSEYDLDRFNDDHDNLSFAETSDDLNLSTKIDLGYPLNYRWWKFTPSIQAVYSQNVSNTDKYRTDAALRLRIDRYYWNALLQYGYNPHIYYRDFTDGDGSGDLENYSYSRNTYRLDLAVKALKKSTLKTNIRFEDYYYNEFFTEADGSALTGGAAIQHHFPAFTLEAGYDYREFTNDNQVDNDDASYQSNIYKAGLLLPRMPLNEKGKTLWQPQLGLNYEQRYYQGGGSWYGGRADYSYTLAAGFDLIFNPQLNLSLDYTHIFRNVESNNESLIRLKEYSENRLGLSARYKF